MKLRQAGEGRPLSDLVTSLQDENLTDNCRKVPDTLVPVEKEVVTNDGSHYLMRILPYRTDKNAILGLVVTFVEIDRLIKAETNLNFFRSIVQTIRHPLIVLDEDLTVVAVNDVFCSSFRTNRDETEGRLIYELQGGMETSEIANTPGRNTA